MNAPPPLTAHVTPAGRIIVMPGPGFIWPPELAPDHADALATQLADAARQSRSIMKA